MPSLTVNQLKGNIGERIGTNCERYGCEMGLPFYETRVLVVFEVMAGFQGVFGSISGQSRESCIASSCKTFKEVSTLWCHADPTHFCQCRTTASGTWQEQVMPCARAGTFFSYKRQTCVTVDMWDQGECFGADESLVKEPDAELVNCRQSCETYADITQLWCHPKDRNAFCQCRPTAVQKVFEPVKMPCANGTLFSFKRQTCMQEGLWTESCPQ
ncbi:hypothetical protein pipiens_006936 [Culex pipiens pipiens]|uniref:Uncharacterized protein n=1 Tax=Culex pipiens pipiens TaxID=38569 RepID=A0ABD1DN07_CULPP